MVANCVLFVPNVSVLLVQLSKVPDVGVPKAGVTSVGLVANTAEPVPVSSVSAVRSWADVNDPRDVALPTEVIAPVRSGALVL